MDHATCLHHHQEQQQQQQQQKCCKTIDFAAINAPSDTTINILTSSPSGISGNSNNSSNHFVLNGTLEISKNLTIQAAANSTYRPVVTIKDAESIHFAFSIVGTQSENGPINLNLIGLDFQDVNIVKCLDNTVICNVHINQCKGQQCKDCSAKFVDIKTTNPAVLSIWDSSFQSGGYSIRILSKDVSMSLHNVTLVSGSRIYIKNTKKDKKLAVRINGLRTAGLFPLYAARFVGHFKELVLQGIEILNTTFVKQGLRVELSTDNKVKSNVTMSDILVQNTTINTGGTDLISVKWATLTISNVSVIRSKLAIAIKISRSVGNVELITSTSGSSMMLLVSASFSQVSLTKVRVSDCFFEKVTIRDYRLGGAYSPYRHKGILFLDASSMHFTDSIVTRNDFGWQFIYTTDSDLTWSRVTLSGNTIARDAIEFTDRGRLLVKECVIKENRFGSRIFNIRFANGLRMYNVQIEGNRNLPILTHITVMLIQGTNAQKIPTELTNVVVRNNSNIDFLNLLNAITNVSNTTIAGNTVYGYFVTVTYGSFDGYNISAVGNVANTTIRDSYIVDGNGFVFDRVTVNIKALNISDNNISGYAIQDSECKSFRLQNCRITGNVIKDTAIYHKEGADLVVNGLVISGNTLDSGLILDHAGTTMENMIFVNNTVSGQNTRVMRLDAFEKRNEEQVALYQENGTNLISYFHKAVLRNITIVDSSSLDLDNQDTSYMVSTSLSIIAYAMYITIENMQLTVSGNQVLAMEMYFPGVFEFALNNFVSNYTIACPVGAMIRHNTKKEGKRTTFSVFCPKCKSQSYSTISSLVRFDGIDFRFKPHQHVEGLKVEYERNAKCHNCPVGGVCENGVVFSKPNYYGYVKSDNSVSDGYSILRSNASSIGNGVTYNHNTNSGTQNQVEYVTCPVEYCCSKSGKKCMGFNTCNYYRHGMICGECDVGYQVSFFTEKCIPSARCTRKTQFWVMFGLVALGFAFVLCFMDNIQIIVLVLPKTIYNSLLCRSKDGKSVSYTEQQQSQKIYTITKETVLNNDSDVGSGINNKSYECDEDNKNSYIKYFNEKNNKNNNNNNNNKKLFLKGFAADSHIKDEESSKHFNGNNSKDNQQNHTDSKNDRFSTTDRMSERTANAGNEPEKSTTPYTWQGIFNCMLSFYQIKSLLNVNRALKRASITERYLEKFTDLFNLEIFINMYSQEFCPMLGLDAISKRVIRVLLLNAAAAVLVIVVWLVCLLYYNTVSKRRRDDNKKSLSELFLLKLEVCLLRIITFGYKNVASVAVTFITCVDINGKLTLFIQANVQCFTYQQYAVFVFLALWVIPIPINLYIVFYWYHDQLMSFREFLMCLVFPPTVGVYWCVVAKRRANNILVKRNSRQFARIREMYEEPYRPRKIKGGFIRVESGNNAPNTNNNTASITTSKYVFWEHWRLIQRLMLSIVTSYLKNPIYKIYLSSPLLLLFFAVYLKVKPFKRSLFVLHWLEIGSLIGICYQLLYNLLKSYLYLYDVPNKTHEELLLSFFRYTEFLFTPLFLFAAYLVGSFMVGFVKRRLLNHKKQYCFDKSS